MVEGINSLQLSGELVERKPLRYTPAGVPVIECRIRHASQQIEAGIARQVECELAAIALGATAHWLNNALPGAKVRVSGFLAARSRNSRQPTLHVNTIEFEEGNENVQTVQT